MDDLNAAQVEELLETIARDREIIREAEENHYNFIELAKAQADKVFKTDTAAAQAEIDSATARLKAFAEKNLPNDKKTLLFPNGKLQFRKAQPKFFFDDGSELDGKNKRLVEFVKTSAPDYLTVCYFANWYKLRFQLAHDTAGNVYFKDTGEILPGVHAEAVDDNFSVITP